MRLQSRNEMFCHEMLPLIKLMEMKIYDGEYEKGLNKQVFIKLNCLIKSNIQI